MATEMNYGEYWREVASLAETITAEAAADGDDLHDRLHETIDGHEWVIYTYRNHEVLRFSENDEYALVEGLYEPQAGEPLNWAAMAYGALYADVMSHEAFGALRSDSEAG